MARLADMPSLRPASCCRVEVVNGGLGADEYSFSSTLRTRAVRPARPAASCFAAASSSTTTVRLVASFPSAEKSRPSARVVPSSAMTWAGKRCAAYSSVTWASHQAAERKAMRSRSRSTSRRVVTLCTRPAERRGAILRHSTGLTS